MFTGELTLNGKVVRIWSTVRKQLKTQLVAGHLRTLRSLIQLVCIAETS